MRPAGPWTAHFDHTYVLSLPSRADRLLKLNKALSLVPGDYEVFRATEASSLPEAIWERRAYLEPATKNDTLNNSRACAAHRLSHVRILEDAERRNFTTADMTALYDHINREASPPKPQNVDPARTAANRARRTSKKRKGRKIQCTIIAAALRAGGHVVEWSREQMTAIETAAAAEDDE